MNATIEFLKEKLSSLFSPIKEKVLSFYEENKKLSIIILSLFLVILICIILLLTTSEKKPKELPFQKLELTETLQIPDGPALPRDYTTSRKTKDKWSEDEAEPWFTVPSQKEIDSLSNANESLVNEIIEAAP